MNPAIISLYISSRRMLIGSSESSLYPRQAEPGIRGVVGRVGRATSEFCVAPCRVETWKVQGCDPEEWASQLDALQMQLI